MSRCDEREAWHQNRVDSRYRRILDMSIDSGERLRELMRNYPQGVAVVTADAGNGPHGITVSSFTSVSLDPPLVLISIAHESNAYPVIERAAAFAVNLLGDDQGALSEHFARSDLSSKQQFRSIPTRQGSLQAPRIQGCLAYLDCRVVDTSIQSDHTLFIGRVQNTEVNHEAGRPLVFYSGDYWGLGSVVYPRRR